ncbi:alpha/beta fold hydrolase [Streptomyces sp. NPDC058391]|uniref:alpha/beta fold hydrolase n=1 Tax=Streptomyces sp. NPDC058391 TaxID=3346476 RepID=UPI003663F576
MPTFSAHDGTELAYRLLGEGEPLVCLPGGPMASAAYLGNLGGLSAHRQLVLLDPRGTGGSAVPDDPSTYRCDRQVDDVEALRTHLGLDRFDLLGHSASGNLATLYAARYPRRLRSLILVTPGMRAVGIEVTEQDRREAVDLRVGEPWYAAGLAAFEEVVRGRATPEAWDSLAPLGYGRWGDAARAHAASTDEQRNGEAAAAFYGDGAFDPDATRAALAAVDAPVLVLAGELDAGPRPERARQLAELFPQGSFAVQPGAAHYPWLDGAGALVRTVAAFLDPGVHSVAVNGVRLAHRVWGAEDAEPVVLVHGRCGSGQDWTEIAERLAGRRRVIAVDLSGHGLSDWPGDYSLPGYRDELRGFLAALGLAGVDVVAHSMGGFAAYLLAQESPELFRRLVLEESPPLFPLDPPRPPAERPGGELGYDWSLVPSIDAQLNEPDPRWRERFDRVTVPTLVIAGGAGSHIAQEKFAWMADRIPDCRLVTIEAGHLVHSTRPAEFLAALEEFGI